ncbi:MAG: hypothetical protein KJ588_02425 [Gammaproteobacteria bacterium]|nr:hypothetical protein [Gammaproteobacteria bacterium]
MSINEELIEKLERLLSLSETKRREKSKEIDTVTNELIEQNKINSETVGSILFTVFSRHKKNKNFLDAFIKVFVLNTSFVNGGSNLYAHIQKCLVSGLADPDWVANRLKDVLLSRGQGNKDINDFTRKCIESFVEQDEESVVLEKFFDFKTIETVFDGRNDVLKQHAYLALYRLWDKQVGERDRIQKMLTENYFGYSRLKWSSNEILKDSYSLALFCVMKSADEGLKKGGLIKLSSYLLSGIENEKTLVTSVLKRLMSDPTVPNQNLRDLLIELTGKDKRSISASFREAFDPNRHTPMLIEMLLDKEQSKIGLTCFSKLSDANKQVVVGVMAKQVVKDKRYKSLYDLVKESSSVTGVRPQIWLTAVAAHTYGQQQDVNAALVFVSQFSSYCTLEELADWIEIKEIVGTKEAIFSNKISDLALKNKEKLEIKKYCINILLNKQALGGGGLFLWLFPFDLEKQKHSLRNTLNIIARRVESDNKKTLGLF